MSSVERLTITLPAEMAGMLKVAVEAGDYASTSEVIREALRDWRMKRELQRHRLDQLRADIDRGLADVTEGRLTEFDPQSIMALGRAISAERAESDSQRKRK